MSVYISTEGIQLLQQRINELLTERPEVIKAVAIAREFGDLSENAEYKAARERQRAIDYELDSLRRRAATLKVIDTKSLPKDAVRFGCTCQVLDEATQELQFYKIVGAHEVNFYDSDEDLLVVSILSPIGNALMGKKLEEVAIVKAPMGERKLKIKKIS